MSSDKSGIHRRCPVAWFAFRLGRSGCSDHIACISRQHRSKIGLEIQAWM